MKYKFVCIVVVLQVVLASCSYMKSYRTSDDLRFYTEVDRKTLYSNLSRSKVANLIFFGFNRCIAGGVRGVWDEIALEQNRTDRTSILRISHTIAGASVDAVVDVYNYGSAGSRLEITERKYLALGGRIAIFIKDILNGSFKCPKY